MYLYSQWSPIIPELTPGTSLSSHCAIALKGLPFLLKDVFALLLHVDYLLTHFSPNLARRLLQYLPTVADGICATSYLVEPCVLSTSFPGIFYPRPPTIQAWLKTRSLRLFRAPPLAPSYATYVWMLIDPATPLPVPLETIEEAEERELQVEPSDQTPETTLAQRRCLHLTQNPINDTTLQAHSTHKPPDQTQHPSSVADPPNDQPQPGLPRHSSSWCPAAQ